MTEAAAITTELGTELKFEPNEFKTRKHRQRFEYEAQYKALKDPK